MQRSKTALVLAGGGIAGAAYEIGALCAIDEILQDRSVNEFDIYVGTSAGALVGSCLANGFTPRLLLAALERSLLGVDQLEPEHLFSLNLADLLARSRRLPAAALDALRRYLADQRGSSLLDLIEALAVGFPTGLYDNTSLGHYLRQALSQPGRTDDFRSLRRELAIVATDLDSGERAVFGLPPLDHVPISRAVCASAAIPIFYRPVRIGSHDYIDGGIRGTASLDVAIERGADLIVCINPMVPFDNRRHRAGHAIGDEGMHRIGNQVFRTFVHAGLHYHLKQVHRQHPDVDIILIEPSRSDRTMFDENTMRYQMRLTIAKHGFESVATHLHRHYDYFQEMLGRHGISISAEGLDRIQQRMSTLTDEAAAVESTLVPGGGARRAPAGLAETLSELDRLLARLERSSQAGTA